MKRVYVAWLPAVVLGLGALFTVGADGQRDMTLRASLAATIPVEIAGQRARDLEVSKAERRVAGMSSYVMRVYSPRGEQIDQIEGAFSVYVGYYTSQTRGRTIHSPKNCLPGSGWEALTSTPAVIAAATGPVTVNRYILQRKQEKALVLYWYQGRGRVESNEYLVKWHLLRDAALMRRSDEALVRIVVPVTTTEDDAFRLAAQVAQALLPAVNEALPGRET
jgi:EpsI family protein